MYYSPRERLELKPTEMLPNKEVLMQLPRSVFKSCPVSVIHFLNDVTPKFLDPHNETHFECAQEALIMYLIMN